MFDRQARAKNAPVVTSVGFGGTDPAEGELVELACAQALVANRGEVFSTPGEPEVEDGSQDLSLLLVEF